MGLNNKDKEEKKGKALLFWIFHELYINYRFTIIEVENTEYKKYIKENIAKDMLFLICSSPSNK